MFRKLIAGAALGSALLAGNAQAANLIAVDTVSNPSAIWNTYGHSLPFGLTAPPAISAHIGIDLDLIDPAPFQSSKIYSLAALGPALESFTLNIGDIIGPAPIDMDTSSVDIHNDQIVSYSLYLSGVAWGPLLTQYSITLQDGADGYLSCFAYCFTNTGLLTVPEPSTWAVAVVGFFGLGAALRRRRTKPI